MARALGQEAGLRRRNRRDPASGRDPIRHARGDIDAARQFRGPLGRVGVGTEPIAFLDGAAEVQQVGDTQDLVATADDEDFPSAATAADGTVYVAYSAFTHGTHFSNSLYPLWKKEPKDFSIFAEPTGGDRIWLTGAAGIAMEQAHRDHRRRRRSLSHGHGRGWARAGVGLFLEKRRLQTAADRRPTGSCLPAAIEDGKLGPLVLPDARALAPTSIRRRPPTRKVGYGSPGKRSARARRKILAARQVGRRLWRAAGRGRGKRPTIGARPLPRLPPSRPKSRSPGIRYAKGDYDVYARTFRGDTAGEPLRWRPRGISRPGPPWPMTATAVCGWRGSKRARTMGQGFWAVGPAGQAGRGPVLKDASDGPRSGERPLVSAGGRSERRLAAQASNGPGENDQGPAR